MIKNYIDLARLAIEEYVKNGKIIALPEDLPNDLFGKSAGVFISIHKKNPKKNGEALRGCIGTFLPTKNTIAQEIIDNAISACSRDYRFSPIKKEELDNLEISIDVLSEPEKVEDISTLDPKKYGILIKSQKDSRSGLLLPDLEGVNTIHDQIAITLNKAGLKLNDPINIFRFSVERFKE